MSSSEEMAADESAADASSARMTLISDLTSYGGSTLAENVDAAIASHDILVISKTHCPFCLDVKSLFNSTLLVPIHIIEINSIAQGSEVQKIVRDKTKQTTVPVVFIRGESYGGCDQIKALHASRQLEEIVADISERKMIAGSGPFETVEARRINQKRGAACNPPFWFPHVVNNYVVRLTGIEVVAICVVAIVFRNKDFAPWLAAYLLLDFFSRILVGSSLSILGMVATVIVAPIEPQFKPGPPKQFAACCGLIFSLIATCLFFTDNIVAGAVILGLLAGAAGLEGFCDFCLGCIFFSWGIRFKIIPSSVYRVYTSSRHEIVESWRYVHSSSGATPPAYVDTDPVNAAALKYKAARTDEFTKDDFDLIRNMQIGYFGAPLSLVGLATAFKLSSEWTSSYLPPLDSQDDSPLQVPSAWYKTFAVIATVVFCAFLLLYGLRLVLYFNKCLKEWDSPHASPYFATITTTLVLFAFVVYDITDVIFGRVLFWIGAPVHFILTIAKFGEWIGLQCDMESFLASWLILPVGLFVSALVAPLVPAISASDQDEPWYAPEGVSSIANLELARFFATFGWLMWITLFVVTFLKVVITHNSDDRLRHSIWIWVAAPCVAGLAEFVMCSELSETMSSGLLPQCAASFAMYYFLGGVLFAGLARAAFPCVAFFWRDKFGMMYWTECFALGTLAACAALYYHLTGYEVSKVLMIIFLVIATIANALALLHMTSALIHRRVVFTPEVKWGPLSFMKLTHEAFRAAMPKLRASLLAVDLADTKRRSSQIDTFIATFSSFTIVLEQHALHEEEVIFKVFNDFFPDHAKKYNEDHAKDFVLVKEWRDLCNVLLTSPTLDGREAMDALTRLQKEIPEFLEHFVEHLQGEEDHLSPIGRRYLPLELQKQISRAVFEMTKADQWEVIVPFIVNNLPRHQQRVRYLKCLAWSMPERAQQIGAIVYRNTDAVMWERLQADAPEIIPRGVRNWRRYF